jgi:hypothetical protein
MSGPQSRTTVARPLGLAGLLVAALAIVAVAVWANLRPGADPSPSPTTPVAIEPSPSPIPTSDAPQTEAPTDPPSGDVVWVEPNVVDRPGVPPELYDNYWAALGQAGQVGTTARIILPRSEELLAVDVGLVASYAVVRDEEFGIFEPVLGPNGATIRIRDLRTGGVIRAFDTGILVLDGVMQGNVLFWTGRTLPGGPESIDAGIWAIDLADSASSPQAIVEPTDLTGDYGPLALRSNPRIGDQGRSVFTSIVGDESRATQVVDIATRSLRATLEGEIAADVADDVALVFGDDALALIDISTGDRIGPVLEAAEVYKTLVLHDEILVQYGPGGGQGVYITALRISDGATRNILHQPRDVRTTIMSPEISSAEFIALLIDDWDYDSAGLASVAVSLLDPTSAELQPEAFVIDGGGTGLARLRHRRDEPKEGMDSFQRCNTRVAPRPVVRHR